MKILGQQQTYNIMIVNKNYSPLLILLNLPIRFSLNIEIEVDKIFYRI